MLNFPLPKFYEITELNRNQFVCFFESGLEIFNYEQVDDKLVKSAEGFRQALFDFSCCGIDINCDSTAIAIGDLAGNIHFYNLKTNDDGIREITRECKYKF